MLKKLKSQISSLIKSVSSVDINEDIDVKSTVVFTHNFDLEINIDWEDISNGMPSSDTNSIISNSFKKYGMIGTATPCKMVLENGDIYIPEQLSDHWEAFIGSPKIKPKTIKYFNVTNI
jgi:hypothetical protein